MNRHKVFVSYYHDDDQKYREKLEELNHDGSLFEDMSVGDGDIDDRYLSDEQIRREIRDNYINTATVLVLLCGPNTKKRKHIDWEIHMAMTNYENNTIMGILVVNLPECRNMVMSATDDEKRLVGRFANNWIPLETIEQVNNREQDLPLRIKNNLLRDKVDISAVNWIDIYSNRQILKELIDISYKRRNLQKYDISDLLMKEDLN